VRLEQQADGTSRKALNAAVVLAKRYGVDPGTISSQVAMTLFVAVHIHDLKISNNSVAHSVTETLNVLRRVASSSLGGWLDVFVVL